MVIQDILGHDEIAEKFRRAISQGRLASTFLFVGPEGVGKRTFAVGLAQALLCETRPPELLDPCGHCPACLQVAAGTHPDFMFVSRPAGKSFIPLGLLKGDEPDYPIRESLLCNLARRPFCGGRKIAIIDDADFLNVEGANCLLKTLEEPPPSSVLILIGTSADRQLPTIRSRAQIVRFRPLDTNAVTQLLLGENVVADEKAARRLASFSGGSLAKARELADPGLWAFRSQLLAQLAQWPLPSVRLAQATAKFVDEAGKEAPLRRARLRLVIGFAADFFRQLVRRLSGLEIEADAEMSAAVERAVKLDGWDLESAGDAADRCLEALAQIDRNANQSTLIEAWLDDVAKSGRHAVGGGPK